MERPSPQLDIFRGKVETIKNRARGIAERILERNSDLIEPDLASVIASREGHEAARKYLEKRKSGFANDGYSKGLGMTIYLTQEGKTKLEKIDKRKHLNISINLEKAMYGQSYSVEFSTGTFGMPDEGALFAGATTKAGRARKIFYLEYEHVIRVEGKHGELWQNSNFELDGRKKV